MKDFNVGVEGSYEPVVAPITNDEVNELKLPFNPIARYRVINEHAESIFAAGHVARRPVFTRTGLGYLSLRNSFEEITESCEEITADLKAMTADMLARLEPDE